MRNKRFNSLCVLGVVAALAHDQDGVIPTNRQTEKSLEQNRESLLEANKLKVDKMRLASGQKKFFYGDNYVWSRDQENADRKARNSGFLTT